MLKCLKKYYLINMKKKIKYYVDQALIYFFFGGGVKWQIAYAIVCVKVDYNPLKQIYYY